MLFTRMLYKFIRTCYFLLTIPSNLQAFTRKTLRALRAIKTQTTILYEYL